MHRPKPVLRCWAVTALAWSLGACSSMHYPVNAALEAGRGGDGYVLRNLSAEGNSDSLVVLVSFSGGGYRAAAMAYAVLEVLHETRIEWDGQQRSLLQEVDAISAVSGGSLAAAHYARDPEHFLQRFRPQVLDLDLQAALLARTLSPSGLWRQTSATYGRGDLLQEVLDAHVFGGLTYGDVPRRRPMVSINATNMRDGRRFEFSQDQFDRLCSDLDRLPLARAVAASMAVPLLMSPITLWNHSERCATQPAEWPVRGSAEAPRYLHLLDGGLADNTGVHSVMESITTNGGLVRTDRAHGLKGVRKRVFIVVNAQVNTTQREDDVPETPGLLRQIRSVVDVPIDRHADSSLRLLEEAGRQWRDELGRHVASGGPADPHAFQVIEINMARVRDATGGQEVQKIPTGLKISPAQIDAIRRFVRQELALCPEWRALLQGLSTQPSPRLAQAHDGVAAAPEP